MEESSVAGSLLRSSSLRCWPSASSSSSTRDAKSIKAADQPTPSPKNKKGKQITSLLPHCKESDEGLPQSIARLSEVYEEKHGCDGENNPILNRKDSNKEKRRFSCASVAEIDFTSAPVDQMLFLAGREKAEWRRFLSERQLPKKSYVASPKSFVLDKNNDEPITDMHPFALHSHDPRLSSKELLQSFLEEKKKMKQDLLNLTQKLKRLERREATSSSNTLPPADEKSKNSDTSATPRRKDVSSAVPRRRHNELVVNTKEKNLVSQNNPPMLNNRLRQSECENQDTTEEASSNLSLREQILWKRRNKRVERRLRRKSRRMRKGHRRSSSPVSKRKYYIHRFGTRISYRTSNLLSRSLAAGADFKEQREGESEHYDTRKRLPLIVDMDVTETHSKSHIQENRPEILISATENESMASCKKLKNPSPRLVEPNSSLTVPSSDIHIQDNPSLGSSSKSFEDLKAPVHQLKPANECPQKFFTSQPISTTEDKSIMEELQYAFFPAEKSDHMFLVSQKLGQKKYLFRGSHASSPAFSRTVQHAAYKRDQKSPQNVKDNDLDPSLSKAVSEARDDFFAEQQEDREISELEEMNHLLALNNDTVHSLEHIKKAWIVVNGDAKSRIAACKSYNVPLGITNPKSQLNGETKYFRSLTTMWTPPTSESLVEGEIGISAFLFEETVRITRALLRLFCLSLVEVRDGLIFKDLNLQNKTAALSLMIKECMPDAKFAHPHHQKYGIIGYVSSIVFQDFQTESYGLSIDSHYPDRQASQLVFWNDFQRLNMLSPQDAIDMRSEHYQKKFHHFCNTKFRMLEERMDWLKVYFPDTLLESFLDVMKHVWQVHLLAFGFKNPASMLYVEEWADYNSYCMKTVENDVPAFTSKVEFMVTPGFELEDRIVKSEVYLMPKTSVISV